MKTYYAIKYPYLNYSYTDTDGDWFMFSVPPKMLSETYETYFNKKPKTFFDCGAATGLIVQMAMWYGMDARGIDIREYPKQPMFSIANSCIYKASELYKLFESKRIEIKSILDCKPINADIAYCNGVLTYFDEQTLPNVLSKFRNVGMLCAIHNTTEDVTAARKMGETLGTCNEPRTIKPNDWWIDTFDKNGFDAKLNEKLHTFIAIPRQR